MKGLCPYIDYLAKTMNSIPDSKEALEVAEESYRIAKVKTRRLEEKSSDREER
ncbi:MAG: hypothetical protein GX682_03515 [Clostridiaceae bacterium]|nr:hypothetical protein [Clostridiaceae bacterium]